MDWTGETAAFFFGCKILFIFSPGRLSRPSRSFIDHTAHSFLERSFCNHHTHFDLNSRSSRDRQNTALLRLCPVCF